MEITPVAIDLADDVVAGVGDEEVPRGVYRHARGVVELGAAAARPSPL